MGDNIRTPIQRRSIEKKRKIIEAGYKLFAEKGYYNTNTSEIAKEAGVSTGIVYGYFRDKRDILIDVLDIYVDNVFTPILALFDVIDGTKDLDALTVKIMDCAVSMHKKNAAIHEALHAMTHTDEAVRRRFLKLEDLMNERLTEKLRDCDLPQDGLKEKVHIAIKTIESYAHECVYDKHGYISYPAMKKLIGGMLKNLFLPQTPDAQAGG